MTPCTLADGYKCFGKLSNAVLNLVLAIPKCLKRHENKNIYQTLHFYYYAVTLTWATCFDSFLSHRQGLFLKIQILITSSYNALWDPKRLQFLYYNTV